MEIKEVCQALDEMRNEIISKPRKKIYLNGFLFSKFTNEIRQKIESYQDAKALYLGNCGVESLQNFPYLPNLVRLDLCGNNFKGADLVHLISRVPKLEEIYLNNNDITSYEEISPLKEIKELKVITLSDTFLSEEDDYKDQLFSMFPGLENLDFEDREGNPVSLSSDVTEED